MSDISMTLTHQDTIVAVLHTLRRATRAIERVLLLDEDDIQRKFKQFLAEHEAFTKKLEAHIDQGLPNSVTPESIIQFPISTCDLLVIVAKSEKQIIDELNDNLSDDLPQNLKTELEKIHQTIAKSYDYTQALADVWS